MVRLGAGTWERLFGDAEFQFQYGAIGSYHAEKRVILVKTFQFQYGAIGSQINSIPHHPYTSFNSSMVRLGAFILCDGCGTALFQFQYGAIGRK